MELTAILHHVRYYIRVKGRNCNLLCSTEVSGEVPGDAAPRETPTVLWRRRGPVAAPKFPPMREAAPSPQEAYFSAGGDTPSSLQIALTVPGFISVCRGM